MFYRLPNITQIKRTNLCHFSLSVRNRFLMGICNTLKQTIRKIPLSVPPLGMNNESTLKRNLKLVCGF